MEWCKLKQKQSTLLKMGYFEVQSQKLKTGQSTWFKIEIYSKTKTNTVMERVC